MKPDGGPAFATRTTIRKEERYGPTPPRCYPLPDHERFENVIETTGGMSLRDYFAAAALTGLLAGGSESILISDRAYEHADAMLFARPK